MNINDCVHDVFCVAHGLFCRACGAYSFSKTVKLHASCRRRPSGPVVRLRLDRLLSGCHPITGAYLGVPAPLGCPAEALFLLLDPPPKGVEVELGG